jgi:hypothetical protein
MIAKKFLPLPLLLFSLGAHAFIAPGFWSTECLKGLKKEQIYSANRVLTNERFYQDGLCANPAYLFSTDGVVEFPAENQTYINFVYVSIFLTLYKESIAADFNQREVCGINSWSAGIPQDITGLQCAIFSEKPAQIPAAGNLRYGIFSVEGDKLYYGRLSQQSDGSSPATRPKTFNRAIEYIFRHSP